MAEKRAITIWVNGKEIKNDISSINSEYLNLLKSQRKMTRGSVEYVEAGKKIRELKGHIDEHNKQLRETGGLWGKIKSSTGAAMLTYAALGAAAISAVSGIINNNKKFEKSLSSLSSLTGATGDDLKYYSKQAREIGKSTTYGADEAVKAFALIGSAKPDLLANKEALVGVTREAIALAEAAEMDLPAAADSLTKVMNQFSLDSSQASRTINVLAAGAKEGAVAIPGISDAIVQFGAVAKTSNVSLEDSVTLIELLGEKGISGAEAGTKLRNVLITLAAGPKETNPQIVGLTKALDNLKAKGMDTTAMTTMFGKENMVAAQILVESSDKVAGFTKAITGTNEAYTQQQINTDNLDGSVKKMHNNIEALSLSFNGNGGLTSAVRWTVDLFSDFISTLAGANQSVDDIKQNVAELDFQHTLDQDRKEVEKYGDSFVKVLQLQIDAEKKRIQTKTKNIDQLLLEKEILGQVTSASIDMTAADIKNSKDNIASLEKRLELGKRIIFQKSVEKDAAKKAQLSDEYIKKEKELAKKLADIRLGIEQMNSDSLTREMAELKKKYDDLEKEAAGHTARLKEIEELRGKEIAELTKKHAIDLAKKLADLQFDSLQKGKTDIEKEIDAASKKYEELEKEAVGNADALKKIEEMKAADISNIKLKHEQDLNKKLDDLQFAANNILKTDIEKEISEVNKKYEELQKDAVGNAAALKRIETQKNAEIEALTQKHTADLLKKIDDLEASSEKNDKDHIERQIAAVKTKYAEIEKAAEGNAEALKRIKKLENDEISAINKKSAEDKFATAVKDAQALGGLLGSISDYESAKADASLNKFKAQNDEKKAAIDKRLKAGLLSESAANKQKEQLDANLAAKERAFANEKAQREKKIRAFEIVVNTASAIAEALPNIPLSIIVGAMGAVQLATVLSTPVQAYAEGGEVTKDSLIRAGEAGREVILSNKTLTNSTTGPISEWLFQKQKGMNPVFPSGSIVSPQTSARSTSFGGAQGKGSATQTNVTAVVPGMDALAAEMREIKQFLSDPKNRQAYISNDMLKKHSDEEATRTSLKNIA